MSEETLREHANWQVDGLILPCARCGDDVPFDFVVRDNVWQENAPEEVQNDVLCLPCLDELTDGIPLNSLLVVYWTGKGGTVPLLPAKGVIEYAERLEEERDAARAERDLLRDALHPLVHRDRHDTMQERCREENCPTCREAREALRLVEAGGTIERIRREAFEEAATRAYVYVDGHEDFLSKDVMEAVLDDGEADGDA